VRDCRPAFDLAHRHNVDAVLIVADGEADELRRSAGAFTRSRVQLTEFVAFAGC